MTDGLHVESLAGGGPPIVVLHGGLDSVSTLRDFPGQLAAATGRRVISYDRAGHGRSRGPADRPDANRQIEAEACVRLLDELRVDTAVLVGHSDGGAIALLAAGRQPGRVAGVVAIAPQLVNHDAVQAGIARAVDAYDRGSLRAALAAHHDDVDVVFRAWSAVWLRSVYSADTVVGDLAAIRCPVAALAALDDPYGFRPNAVLIAEVLAAPLELSLLSEGGHLPHHTRRAQVVALIGRLLERA